MTRNLAAALGLAALSPFVAEFLLGDAFLGGRGPSVMQLPMFALFVLFYGSAAVLIREFARRTGRGWPAIVPAALAFGVLEEGLLTQSLFNPDYVGQHLLAPGYVPALGIGVPWTLFVLTLHTVWSISVPIAIAERAAPDGPWLGRRGLITFGVLVVLGAAAVFAVSYLPSGFLASPAQLVVTAVLAVALVAVGFRLPARTRNQERTRTPGRTRNQERTRNLLAGKRIPPVLLLVGGAAVSTVFQVARGLDGLPVWLLCTLLLVLQLGSVAVIGWLSRVTVWDSGQVFGLGAGAVLTYCWVGLHPAAVSGTGALAEQCALVVIAVAVIAAIGVRTGAFGVRRAAEPVRAG